MEQKSTFENRLANERSPYLLQHKNNPVDWYPWGEEAFEKAKADNKLIFLSVGYSTCHWCHVMAHESFEDPKVAQIMNELFVNIKVDREERPDVDKIYMTFVQMVSGGGGWPMSVWLTPDLKPVMGGTYYPPHDNYGRPGFTTICKFLNEKWENEGDKMLESAERVYNAMKEAVETEAESKLEFNHEPIKTCFRMLNRMYDPKFGGFSKAPKFPRPVIFNFLFQMINEPKTLEMISLTLKNMGEGGMYDHLDGGFHRYSVTADWHIPHFEKMLYDQGQIVNSYLDAFVVTKDPYFQKKARETLNYVIKCLTSPEGGFYSAEDADSIIEYGKPEHAEGAFYVWTFDQISSILGQNAPLFCYHFGVLPDGNVAPSADPHGELTHKNHIKVTHSLAETAEKFGISLSDCEKTILDCKKLLNSHREKRPRPHLDDKIITAWNGLTISAFARAYQILDDPMYLRAAQRAAQFIKDKLYKDQYLIRNYRNGPSNIRAFADDYSFLIQGLLDLYEANFEIEWLQWANQLQDMQNKLFWDSKAGGYFAVEEGDKNLMLRMKEDYDGAEPCNNSVSALNLLRLADMVGNEKYRENAEAIFHYFKSQLTDSPIVVPQMCVALNRYLSKPMQIVFAGKKEEARSLILEANKHFIPNKVVLLADGEKGQEWLSERLEFVKGIKSDKPAAYVCENYACQLPVSNPAELSRMLDTRK